MTEFPVIDMQETGKRIDELREEKGITVREMAEYFGFQSPQSVYKWLRGKSLPSLDNLCALSALFGVLIEEILVKKADGAEDGIAEVKKEKE